MALTDENMVLPVQPMGYGNNNGGFGFGGDWGWLILLLILGGSWSGFGMGGFGGAAMAMDGGFGLYPWLNNSQNINDGFRDQMLNSNVTSIRDGIQGLSTQLCQCCGDMRYDMSNGFNGVNNSIFGAQTAISQQLNTNELASLNRSFAEQMANAQGFNNINAGIADLRYTEATENCATRANSTQNSQNIINAITAGIQSIKDDLCADRLEAERRENANLRTQLSMAQLAASQNAQTATIQAGQRALANEVEQYVAPKAIPAYVVQNPNCCAPTGCGCGSF